ncbi:hypothetical protein F5050DRAFT_1805302 [Lentinula boryana]|uniref:Uncharacterized protein n=1 Tax=Lentinula boryana TaxID=40481 RepID=A0ABQ8QKV1_9AGAR|nr:hypothetical protein F5050DRAFT_1805302 [Lentinula boryana]
MEGDPPAEQSNPDSAATFRTTASSSRDILFGETGIKKGLIPVKYGSKKKAVQGYLDSIPPSARPRNLEAIRIDLLDSSAGTSSRKRPLASSDDDSDIEILSPLTPLIPTTNYELNSKAKSEECWDIEGLGKLVWVRVNHATQIFDAKDDDDNDGTTNKKQIVGMAKGGITVRPYGTLGESLPTICIQNPSADNILSLTDSLGRPRFGSTSARRKPMSVFGSPKKKQKHALSAANPNWQAAVCEILRDKEDEDDGLPPIEFALSAASRFASASASQGANSSKRHTRTTGKPKWKERDSDDNETVDQNASEGNVSDWDPPEADEMLDIPGELVLARNRADRKIAHWPAKLLAYIPPLKPKGRSRQKEPKYRVLWLDDTKQEVPRSWFYACHEPEFGTCEMGNFSSDYPDNPEDDAEDLAQLSDSTTLSRSSSPVPLPSLSCTFNDLPIRAQLAYLKPVLQAILNGKYAPAKDRHDSFMKGGKARAGLGASAGLRGTIPPRDVDKLQEHLSNWCFQDEIKAPDFLDNAVSLDGSIPHPLGHVENAALLSKSIPSGSAMSNTLHHFSKENTDPEDEEASRTAILKESTLESRSSPALTEDDFPASPSAPPPPSSLLSVDDHTILNSQVVGEIIVEDIPVKSERQKSCLSYENLTKMEKINYCLNVLLPEAVLQLLLWRNGHRSSVELLSDFEEVELHQKAEKLAEETDWVFDVVRLREIKVRQLKKQASKVGITSGPDGLTRTSSKGRRIPTSKYQM